MSLDKSHNCLLDAKDVAMTFDTTRGMVQALMPTNLSLFPNQMISIMGPSGSGKTTLLSILGLLLPATEGKLTVLNEDPWELNDHELSSYRNSTIGFIFQAPTLLPHLNSLENVLLPVWANRVHGRRTYIDRAQNLLEDVGLGHRLKHKPSQLSGGEQQRVAIARALIMNPKIVIADEPTGSVDRKQTSHILSLLREKADDERGIIIATHDDLVGEFCDIRIRIGEKI